MRRNPLIFMVRLAGFEPATYGLEVRCSIQLSYRRIGCERFRCQVLSERYILYPTRFCQICRGNMS